MAIGTGFGVHHHHDYYWNPPNLIEFCEDLKAHGVSAYTLWANDLHQIDLCKGLCDHGIEVVYRPGLARIPSRIYPEIVTPYKDAGARYCQWYNEPNLWEEWEGEPATPEHFAELWAPRCYELKALGFVPVVPPLSPGGNIWHPEFFNRMVGWWKSNLDVDDLLSGCVLGIHNRPTSNPPDSEDVCSFNGYKWYRRRMQELLGYSPPMVAPEAGYQPEDIPRVGSGYNWHGWMEWNLELIRRFRPDHPEYVGDDFLFQCFWILRGSGTWLHCGLVDNWYYGHDTGMPAEETKLWQALGAEDWGSVPSPEPPPVVEPVKPSAEGVEFVGLTEGMIERLSFSGPAEPADPYWRIRRVEIQPETNKMDLLAVVDGPSPQRVRFFWSDGGLEAMTGDDPYAPVGARVSACSMPMFNAWGCYGVEVLGNSESVMGLGLYGDAPDLEMTHTAHHPVLVYFEYVEPGSEPGGGEREYKLIYRLEGAPHGFEDLREEIEKISDLAALEASRRVFGDLRMIVIHHSVHDVAPPPLNVASEKIRDGHPTIPYHFCISPDGRLHWTARLIWSTWHTYLHYEDAVGICFLGDFSGKLPTEAALETCRFLIMALYEFFGQGWGRFRLLPTILHKDVWNGEDWHTACPGLVGEGLYWSEGDWPLPGRSL